MLDSFNIICPCGYQDPHKNAKLLIQCTSCQSYQHKYCMKSMVKMPGYQCPYCQFKKGALFFNILYSLIDPSLIEFSLTNKNLSSWVNFIPDVNIYSTFNKKYFDSPIAIIIRCLRLDNNGFSFHWPKMSKIFINDKIILDLTKKGSKHLDKMITLIQEKDFNDEKIKKKFFFYDTNIVKIEDYLIEEKPNRLQVQLNISDEENLEYKNFIVSIDLCEILNETESIIKSVPIIKNKNEIKKIIINNENENNILSLKEKISLLDIYTETDKIKIPARGQNCCHLNVFDLETFLIMNRKTNKFQCPYCKRNSNDLYIDGNIYDFIQEKNNEKIQDILIDKDMNILLEDNMPISEINSNSNSNDETSKTEIKKITKKQKKERKKLNSFKKQHYLRKQEVIHITDDESENDEKNNLNNFNDNDDNNDNFNIDEQKKEKIVDENENSSNIITDLGNIFNDIRNDILSKSKKIYEKNKFKKNKSCTSSEKYLKNKSNIFLGVKKDNIFVNSGKNKLKLKFENPFNKLLSKKRKKINFCWSGSLDNQFNSEN